MLDIDTPAEIKKKREKERGDIINIISRFSAVTERAREKIKGLEEKAGK
jgi:hypothetical protein